MVDLFRLQSLSGLGGALAEGLQSGEGSFGFVKCVLDGGFVAAVGIEVAMEVRVEGGDAGIPIVDVGVADLLGLCDGRHAVVE